MSTQVKFREKYYGFEYDINEVSGSCGTCSVFGLVLDDDVRKLNDRQLRVVSRRLGLKILQECRNGDYGVAIFTTIDKGGMSNPYEAYYSGSDSMHNDRMNLGTVAKALGGVKGVAAANPNTGNIITSYSVVTAEDCGV